MFDERDTKMWNRRFALPHSWKLLPMLGLKAGQHLPTEGVPPKEIHPGVWVRIIAKAPGQARRGHRTQAQCPVCLDWYCAGHLDQHVKGHGWGKGAA